MVKVGNYEVPEGIHYSEDYMWVRVENGKARIGITDYAQKQLREIVFVELPSEGDTLTKAEPFGTVESVKAVSDLVAPIGGEIEQVNEEISEKPELLNEDPYDKGWLLVVSPTNLDAELKQLMDFNKAVEWHKEHSKEG
ncbi:MAG: glycine cleavage system protein GcvH [Candidatus Bathyarchaeota archaeon]|nr:MAG: glycine cleavage system protein GcvH [Candidatus Bathyarchaeota archaeon]